MNEANRKDDLLKKIIKDYWENGFFGFLIGLLLGFLLMK